MLDEIILEGSNFVIGKKHGELLKEDIVKTFQIYLKLWGIEENLKISQE